KKTEAHGDTVVSDHPRLCKLQSSLLFDMRQNKANVRCERKDRKQKQEQPKRHSADEWIVLWWYLHTTEYHSAVRVTCGFTLIWKNVDIDEQIPRKKNGTFAPEHTPKERLIAEKAILTPLCLKGSSKAGKRLERE
ncbi:hypothetical protein STEG23_019293, partial [Scotinomys teguina]